MRHLLVRFKTIKKEFYNSIKHLCSILKKIINEKGKKVAIYRSSNVDINFYFFDFNLHINYLKKLYTHDRHLIQILFMSHSFDALIM